jgi:transglycosylase-like protein with SLT domain
MRRPTAGCRAGAWWRSVLVAALLLPPTVARAASPAALCAAAIEATERSARLPRGLLSAIGRVESGRPDATSGALIPWPWTIDVGGVGHFYATKADAIAAVQALAASGVRSVDVGCLQVNLAYHPTAFRDLEEAFEPATNVRYGALFLRRLFAASGSWDLAAAAYHSQTPQLGAEYRARVFAQWRGGGKVLPLAPASPYPSWPPPGLAYAALPPTDFAYRALAPPARAQPTISLAAAAEPQPERARPPRRSATALSLR